MSDQDLQTAVQEYITNLRDMLEPDCEVSCSVEAADDGEQRVINVVFDGEKLGHMIGNRGQHLRSLQFIISMMVNKKFAESDDERFYVNVDVSGYKEERNSKIEDLALRLADDARILGDAIDMEPMPAAERRVVHMTLQKFDDIKTESFGEGRDRAIRIIPSSEEALGISMSDHDASDEAVEESEEE